MNILTGLFCFALLMLRAGGKMASSDSRSAHARREQVSFNSFSLILVQISLSGCYILVCVIES